MEKQFMEPPEGSDIWHFWQFLNRPRMEETFKHLTIKKLLMHAMEESNFSTINQIFNLPKMKDALKDPTTVENQLVAALEALDMARFRHILNLHQNDVEVTIQKQLMDALEASDITLFQQLLNHPQMKAASINNQSHYTSCLEVACRTVGAEEFVKALLTRMKPNINQIVPEPIHHAAQFGCDGALHILIKHKKTKLNAVNASGWTALHFLAKNFKDDCSPEARIRFERCIALLMDMPQVDINRPNNMGCTPIHHAAFHGNKSAVISFLRHGFNDIDLDTYRGIGKTARQVILHKFPELEGNLPSSRNRKYTPQNAQMKLLALLQDGDLTEFRRLLRKIDSDGNVIIEPNYWYGKLLNTTCLEMACKEPGREEFVNALLEAGANPNAVNPMRGSTAIHIAVESGNLKALDALLCDRRTNVNAVDLEGKTGLHYSLCSTDNNATECVSHILNHAQVNVNMYDRDGHSPIYLAAIHGKREVLELMLQHNVELDYVINDKTVRGIIIETFPDMVEELLHCNACQHTHPCPQHVLFQYLYNRQLDQFVDVVQSVYFGLELLNVDNGTDTLLQYACMYGLLPVADALVRCGANTDKTTNANATPPVVIASKNKHFTIVNLLIPCTMIDATDVDGNTALHYAAKAGHLDTVLKLLNRGANYTIRNVFSEAALSSKATESLLDQCIRVDDQYFPKDKDYKIIFNCQLLVPRYYESRTKYQTSPETRVLIDRTGRQPDELHHEMDILVFLSKTQQRNKILKHPVVTVFLTIKWQQIRKLFYINILLNILLLIFLNLWILLDLSREPNDGDLNTVALLRKSRSDYRYILAILVLILMCLIVREVAQMIPAVGKYFKALENYIDVGTIIFSVLTFVPFDVYLLRQTIRVVAIFLSWTEIFLILGRHPVLSFQVHLFKRVSLEFLRFLSWYFFLIVAFASSFYIMFGRSSSIFFNDWFLSLFKSIMMMTGEYELAEGIPLSKLPVVSHLVFTLFVFLVAIVMFNMLTGLAVNDVASLKQEAEFLAVTARIQLMRDLECVLLPLLRWCRAKTALRCLTTSSIFKIWLFPPDSERNLFVKKNGNLEILSSGQSRPSRCRLFKYLPGKPNVQVDTLTEALRIVSGQTKSHSVGRKKLAK